MHNITTETFFLLKEIEHKKWSVPAEIYNILTKKKVDALQFNHIANVLCFQNMRLIADKQQNQDEPKEEKK